MTPPTAPPPAPRVVVPRGEPNDPLRASLLEVLRQLNAAESYADERERGMELDEIIAVTSEHWTVHKAGVKIPQTVGLLLRNRMVDYVNVTGRSWTRQRDFGPHYRINGAGKLFLAKWVEESQRVASKRI